MKAQLFTLLAAAAVGTGTVQARGEYAEIARLRSMNETVRGIRSMADGEHYTILEGNNIVRYGYATAGQGEQHAPQADGQPRRHGLRLLARRTADTHRLGRQADLPPFLHDRLFPGLGQQPDARTPRGRSPARRLVLARRQADRLFRPQRPLCLRHGGQAHAPHHRRRGVELGHQRHHGLGLRGGVRLHAEPMPSRPTAAASPTCVSTNRKCP